MTHIISTVIDKLSGDIISGRVIIQNNGNVSHTFYARLSLVPQGRNFGFDLPGAVGGGLDMPVTLNPGQTGTARFSGRLPSGAALGIYDAVGAVFEGVNLQGRLDEFVQPSVFLAILPSISGKIDSISIT